MARAPRPSYVDTGNPALAIDCPRCGLITSRFLRHCRNCGFMLWPSGPFASAAFQAWRDSDPARARSRRYDVELAPPVGAELVDYQERAHHLGIHLFPSSNFPIVICLGFLLLGLAAVPFPAPARVVLAVTGGLAFLVGVVGWVVLEDSRMYPGDALTGSAAHPPGPKEEGR